MTNENMLGNITIVDVWLSESTDKEYTIECPSEYLHSGTPVCPESDMDCIFLHRIIKDSSGNIIYKSH